ncbi:MAG: site-specific integrase [Gemmatimonadetes bacterium]|nr:site-specific integrase [Gemmatimonadota bacterium]
MARQDRRGSIEPRGPDRWRVRVSLGRDLITGKWIRTSRLIEGTKRDAERALTVALQQQDRGPVVPRARLTLGAWLDEYAKTWSGHLSGRTREAAGMILPRYLPPALLEAPLGRLTARAFQDLYNHLAGRETPLAPSTINYLHRVLRVRLNKAVVLGYLGQNPLAAVRAPIARHREYRVFSPEEARLFLAEAEGDRFGALWILLLLTGIRPEEALGLKWEDLDGAKIRVRRALVRLAKGRWDLTATKTRRERSVTLPGPVVRALQRHKAKQAELRLLLGTDYADHGLVFAATFGQPLRWETITKRHFWPVVERLAFRLQGRAPVTVTRKGLKPSQLAPAFKAAQEAATAALAKTGLDRLRPYDLRHSAATLLLAAGEHPKVVAERLGHVRVTLTLDTYSHVLPGLEERAAERLETVIFGAPAQRVGI